MLLCGYFLRACFRYSGERLKNGVKMSVYKILQKTEHSWFVLQVVKGNIIFN